MREDMNSSEERKTTLKQMKYAQPGSIAVLKNTCISNLDELSSIESINLYCTSNVWGSLYPYTPGNILCYQIFFILAKLIYLFK